jgi:DNA-binding SARP family transcriptional activator/TolB-like protein
MVHLRILGAADLRNQHDEEVEAVLAQPKRLALLAYLALCAQGRFVRRDTVLAMFWPESDEERARGAFRQAVRFLRKSLGDGVIVNRGADEIAIADGALWCDAAEYRRLLRAGDPAEAIELYRGDLLEGLHVADAPAFEDWLDGERSTLRDAAARAAIDLADRHEDRDALPEATRWARRALELAPYDEAAARRLILLLDRAGDRAGAVAAYESFASSLSRELDIEPSPETHALMQAVRQRTGDGSDFPQIENGAGFAGLDLRVSGGDSIHLRSHGAARRTPRFVIAASVVAALLVLASIAFVQLQSDRLTPQTIQPLMVVPFDNRTGNSDLDPLANMAADWITQGIAQTGAFEVVPATAVLTAHRHVETAGRTDDERGRRRSLVRETGARSLVTGSYYRQNDSLFFHAQVTRARDGRVLAVVERVGVSVENPLDGVDQVRRRVLAAMAPLDAVPTHARAAVTPPTYEAYRAYVAGMEAFVRLDFPTALQHYERAAAADDSYPMPLLASAITHRNLGADATADSIARRVEAFRGRLGPLEEITLDVIQAWLRGDDTAAYNAMVRHRRIAPGTIGHYQVAEQARRLNRPRETIRVLRELGPERGELRGWIPYWRELTAAHHMLGQHRRELKAARRARALYPDDPLVMSFEVRALAALGRVRQIDDVIAERLSSPSDGLSSAALMLHAAEHLHAHGHEAAARDLAGRAVVWYEARLQDEEGAVRYRLSYADALGRSGRYDEAEHTYRFLLQGDSSNASRLGRIGVALARRGERVEAEAIADRLAQQRPHYHRHVPTYWRAAIAAHLGDDGVAVTLLSEAFTQGMQHGPWLRSDPNLEPLRASTAFRELIRPKG